MSKSHKTRPNPSTQEQASELQNAGTHAHEVAEQSTDSEHLKPHELSRLSEEHNQAQEQPSVGHGMHSFGHKEIAALAHELWQGRGCPEGSADEDWNEAVKQLRASNVKTHRAAGG
jgi:hypothetical protein